MPEGPRWFTIIRENRDRFWCPSLLPAEQHGSHHPDQLNSSEMEAHPAKRASGNGARDELAGFGDAPNIL